MIEHIVGSYVAHHKVQTRWRAVHCAYCGAEFAYEQNIAAVGHALDLFHMTYAGAKEIAERKAVRDLNKKLQCMDHSPEACPSCASYQPDMCKAAAQLIGAKRLGIAVMVYFTFFIIVQIGVMYFVLSNVETMRSYPSYFFLVIMMLLFLPTFGLMFAKQLLAPWDINSHAYKAQRKAMSQPSNILFRSEFESRLARVPGEVRELFAATGAEPFQQQLS